MHSWLEERIWIGKGAQATEMTASLRILSSKADSTPVRASQGVNWSWSQCIKSHYAKMSLGKGLPSHFWTRDNVRSILPGLKRKRTGLLFSGPKSSFQIKVHFAFNLEIKVWSLEEEWRGTESKLFEIQCEVSEVSDDFGCFVICWCWSTVFYQVQSQCSRLPGDLGALYASICWQALWRCWFSFPAAPAHSAKTTSKWFADNGITVLDWPATCLTWTPYGINGIFSRERWEIQQYRRAEGSIVPQQCHRLIASMPLLAEAGIFEFRIFDFHELYALIIKIKTKKLLKCFSYM